MKLKDYLQLKGLTQKEFAEAAKITESTVSRLLNSTKIPERKTIKAVEKATNNMVTWVDLIAQKVTDND